MVLLVFWYKVQKQSSLYEVRDTDWDEAGAALAVGRQLALQVHMASSRCSPREGLLQVSKLAPSALDIDTAFCQSMAGLSLTTTGQAEVNSKVHLIILHTGLPPHRTGTELRNGRSPQISQKAGQSTLKYCAPFLMASGAELPGTLVCG